MCSRQERVTDALRVLHRQDGRSICDEDETAALRTRLRRPRRNANLLGDHCVRRGGVSSWTESHSAASARSRSRRVSPIWRPTAPATPACSRRCSGSSRRGRAGMPRPRRRRPSRADAAGSPNPGSDAVSGPSTAPATASALPSPNASSTRWRARRIVPSPCVMQCRGHVVDRVEEARVVVAGLLGERLHPGERGERRAGLVEADVAVGADSEDLQVDAAGLRDRALVVVAGVLDAVERSVRHADPARVEPERLDDLARDHRAVALGMRRVECRRTRRARTRARARRRRPAGADAAPRTRAAASSRSRAPGRPRGSSARAATISSATSAPPAAASGTMTISAMGECLLPGRAPRRPARRRARRRAIPQAAARRAARAAASA